MWCPSRTSWRHPCSQHVNSPCNLGESVRIVTWRYRVVWCQTGLAASLADVKDQIPHYRTRIQPARIHKLIHTHELVALVGEFPVAGADGDDGDAFPGVQECAIGRSGYRSEERRVGKEGRRGWWAAGR